MHEIHILIPNQILIHWIKRVEMELTTERLIIRSFTQHDWLKLQDLSNDREKSPFRHMDHQWPTDVEDIKKICNWFSETDAYWAICLRRTNDLIGFVCLNYTDAAGIKNLGYCLHSGHHNKGYAFEACSKLLRHAFDDLGCQTILSGTGIKNLPSVKLLEKLGFVMTSKTNTHFRTDENGHPILFESGSYQLTRERWFANEQCSDN